MIDEILEANGNIYQTIVPKEDTVLKYRILSLKEYNVFRSLRASNILNEQETAMKVFERCFLGEFGLLSPNLPAGILISIGNLIMWMSGDCDNVTLMEDLERHQRMNPNDTVYAYIQAAIITVFPIYTLEDIESWDREVLLKKFTIAENILEKQREGYSRLKLERVDPKKKMKNSHKIDFEKENAMIRRHQNAIDLEETENKIRKSKLSKEQLSKLERSRR